MADDPSAMDFVEAGFVVLAPAFRGELGNPGFIEGLYGETDDLLAALERLRSMPAVDPERVYLVGHGTGGTQVLLAAAAGARARATIVLGGQAVVTPDLYDLPEPFSDDGARLRSAIHWAGHLEHPVYAFDGDGQYMVDLATMAASAKAQGQSMTLLPVPGTDHLSMLTPVRRVLIPKMLADTPGSAPFTVTEAELYAAVVQVHGSPQ